MKTKIKDQISNYIDKNREWLIKSIFDVVAKNSINTPPDGNENNAQEVIERIFKELNLEIDRFSPDDIIELKNKPYFLKGRSYGNRDNVVGQAGEGKKFTLIFNGHIDTVPSDTFKWQKTEPFEPVLSEERIYGLGVADMKAGIISSIFALKTVKETLLPRVGNLKNSIAFTMW